MIPAKRGIDAFIPSADALADLQEQLAKAIYADSPHYNNSGRTIPWEKVGDGNRSEFRHYAASALNFMRERIQTELNAIGGDLVLEPKK